MKIKFLYSKKMRHQWGCHRFWSKGESSLKKLPSLFVFKDNTLKVFFSKFLFHKRQIDLIDKLLLFIREFFGTIRYLRLDSRTRLLHPIEEQIGRQCGFIVIKASLTGMAVKFVALA